MTCPLPLNEIGLTLPETGTDCTAHNAVMSDGKEKQGTSGIMPMPRTQRSSSVQSRQSMTCPHHASHHI